VCHFEMHLCAIKNFLIKLSILAVEVQTVAFIFWSCLCERWATFLIMTVGAYNNISSSLSIYTLYHIFTYSLLLAGCVAM
jgi:hypothetical protein